MRDVILGFAIGTIFWIVLLVSVALAKMERGDKK